MRITFIGTSHGVPDPNRRCTCTMIEVSGRYYFIDMGTQAIEDLADRGIDIHDVRGIFITHPHCDHSDGLVSFVTLISWCFKDADPVISLPQMSMADGLTAWIRGMDEPVRENLRYQETKPGVVYDDGFVKITAIPTQHCRNSYAYYIEGDGKKVLFTGDLKSADVDFPQIAFEESMDLIIIEAAHFSPDIAEQVLEKCDVKCVAYHHINSGWLEQLGHNRNKKHSYKYILTTDGLELVL